MNAKSIAVYAGTPVDTAMGVCLVERYGMKGRAYPVSENPVQQTQFQNASRDMKEDTMRKLIQKAAGEGCGRMLVYCNSLAGSVDFTKLSEEMRFQIVTPLDTYRGAAGKYHTLGVIAANSNGANGIERTLRGANPDLHVYAASLLDVVMDIEAGMDPEEIVRRHALDSLADWFEKNGCEAMILGCTHFPYFKEALKRRITLPVVDPDDDMIQRLKNIREI
ncbi:MAG: aspartate/glutamate racemase family protein [Eubacteriales bacterium]|nr:aspartate/glutamate racemase family protein [Eubacteriales bacterium]